MADVQRYCACADGHMESYDSGDYVDYEDYAELDSQHEDLKEKYNALLKQIGDLWRDNNYVK